MKIYLGIDGTMIHEDLSENYGKPTDVLKKTVQGRRGNGQFDFKK